MTARLEDVLNIDHNQRHVDAVVEDHVEESFTALEAFDKIAAGLPLVTGLGESSDRELDELATKAINAYDDIMDLGMNVEPRYSARLFEVASSMLKNAIDAKTAKLDKKIKMLDLQIKKQKVDQTEKQSEEPIEGEGFMVSDRNSLLASLQPVTKGKKKSS